ncbi:hypothetical protein D3C79_899840 [compost metagenome]
MRGRIMQKQKIGEHFDSSIRHITRYEWVFKTTILESQDDSAVFSFYSLYFFYSGYTLLHFLKNEIKSISMVLVHKLRNKR